MRDSDIPAPHGDGRDRRIGVDVGGTKIEAVALLPDGHERDRTRIATPHGNYDATVQAIADLIHGMEQRIGQRDTVGIGIPGTISPATGLVKNANSTWLIGRSFDKDLATALTRPVRMANDANCFALSEATDGAGRDANIVFGVIVGTGTGGGSSSMVKFSLGQMQSPVNGATTPYLGQMPVKHRARSVIAGSTAASRSSFQDLDWPAIIRPTIIRSSPQKKLRRTRRPVTRPRKHLSPDMKRGWRRPSLR